MSANPESVPLCDVKSSLVRMSHIARNGRSGHVTDNLDHTPCWPYVQHKHLLREIRMNQNRQKRFANWHSVTNLTIAQRDDIKGWSGLARIPAYFPVRADVGASSHIHTDMHRQASALRVASSRM